MAVGRDNPRGPNPDGTACWTVSNIARPYVPVFGSQKATMEPTFVKIRYSRVFPHPIGATYAWLTDYQDDDPSRTEHVVVKRRVLSRSPTKIVMEGRIEMLGSGGDGLVDIDLDPPGHYRATIVKGRGRGSVFDYRLTSVPGGTRLDVVYGMRVKRWSSRLKVVLTRPAARRKIAKMWDGFADAMRKDLGENDAKKASRVPA